MGQASSRDAGSVLPDRGPLTHRIMLAFRATRPFSFPCSVMPVLVATAAVRPIGEWLWGRFAASLVAVLGVHICANLLNDYFDFMSGLDVEEDGFTGRPGRMLVSGEIKPGQVLSGALAALAVSFAAIACLAVRAGPLVFVFYALAVAGAYSYTAPPIKLKSRALGEVAMLVYFGPVIMGGTAFAQVGRIPLPVLLLSVPMGLAVTHILTGNNLRDFDEDAAGGARTLAHVIGRRGTAALYWALALICAFGVAAIGLAYGVSLLALSVLALLTIVTPLRAVLKGRRLPDIDARTAKFNLALGLITTAALIISGGI